MEVLNDCDLRVFKTKWAGDDIRIKFRDYGMDPDHSVEMKEKGLKSGDYLGTECIHGYGQKYNIAKIYIMFLN